MVLKHTFHTAEDLHKCEGCTHIAAIKCKIFMQSTAMMETILAYRKCCFKEYGTGKSIISQGNMLDAFELEWLRLLNLGSTFSDTAKFASMYDFIRKFKEGDVK